MVMQTQRHLPTTATEGKHLFKKKCARKFQKLLNHKVRHHDDKVKESGRMLTVSEEQRGE